MANVIIKNKEQETSAEQILQIYGANRNDPAMREAAEIIAARTNEIIKMAER